MHEERGSQRSPRSVQPHVERVSRQAETLGVRCAITSP
jgi:hypothetical protein